MGITQEVVLGKEGSDEGNESCEESVPISSPYKKFERKELTQDQRE